MVSNKAPVDVEPKIGDIRKGNEVEKSYRGSFIWVACPNCGQERWVRYVVKRKETRTLRCISCAYKERGPYKVGHKSSVTPSGYILTWVSPKNPFFSMATHHSRILKHRLVMAQHLGRCLTSDEVVHHLNGIKDDNRIENLSLVTDREHQKIIAAFNKKIKILEENGRNQAIRIRELELRLKEVDNVYAFSL